MLVKCPKCGEVKRVYHDQFRHCRVQYRSSSYKADNPSSETNPSENDLIKEAIAERLEKGELSGSGDVMVKGVPVHFEFMSKGAQGNPCPPGNLKVEPEPKVKVFNASKLSDHKAEAKVEEKIEEAVEDGEKESVKVKLKEGKKADEEALKCPECDEELTHVKRLEFSKWTNAKLSDSKGRTVDPEDVEFYECVDCKALYTVKKEGSNPEANNDCPYCDEELYSLKGSDLLYCPNCHKVFNPD